MKITMIGASGFVGTRLLDLMKESTTYELKNIDLVQSHFFPEMTIIGDVREQDQMDKELQKIIQLTHFARLSINPEQAAPTAEEMSEILKKDYALTDEDLQKELNRFKKDVLPKKEAIIKQKASKIMRDIVKGLKKLEKGKSLSTNDNQGIYHRMQEILAIDPKIANQALQDEEEKANVTHTIIHRTNMKGDDLGGHTYYFSFNN